MKLSFLFLLSGFAFLILSNLSCTEPSGVDQDNKVDKPVMRTVSELVNLMFKMEGDLKLIRSNLMEDSTFSGIQSFKYGNIFTAEASKDVQRDSVFVVNGTAYLAGVHQLSQATSRDSAIFAYNNVVSACVTCHQSYCPGPVARIKKLKIN